MLDAAIDDSTPEAAKWLSHTLWSKLIADYYSKNFHHAMGWFHGSVDTTSLSARFERLLATYPDDFATLGVRYAIAHTYIAAGLHEKAAALLLELAEEIPVAASPDFRPRHMANIYFFTARAARKIGDTASAKLYASKAMDQKVEANRRGAWGVRPMLFYTAYSPPQGLIPGKKGYWYVAYSEFPVVEDGRVIFQSKQPFDQFIERLYNELHDKAVVGQTDRTLEQIYEIVETSHGRDGVRARLNFIRKLTEDFANKSPVSGRFYFFILPDVVHWLKSNASDDDLVIARHEVTNLFQIWRKAWPKYQVPLEVEIDVNLMLGLVEEARDAARPWLENLYLPHLSEGSIIGMTDVIRHTEEGTAAGATFCEREFNLYEGKLLTKGQELGTDYMTILYACANAYEMADQPQNAARLYRYGIAQPIFERDRRRDDVRGSRNHYIAALHYSLALIEERMGHREAALSLYEDVVAMTETRRDWFPYRRKYGLGGYFPLYTNALRKIEDYRKESAN